MTTCNPDLQLALIRIIAQAQARRNWASLPGDFQSDAVKACRESIRPHFRGKANNCIKARVRLAKADTWDGLLAAVIELGGVQ